MNKRWKGVVRFDKRFMKHISNAHPESIPAKGRFLLDMGFAIETYGDVAPNGPELLAGDDVPNNRELLTGDVAQNIVNQFAADVARGQMGQQFWR
jgi:hypothetical protein